MMSNKVEPFGGLPKLSSFAQNDFSSSTPLKSNTQQFGTNSGFNNSLGIATNQPGLLNSPTSNVFNPSNNTGINNIANTGFQNQQSTGSLSVPNAAPMGMNNNQPNTTQFGMNNNSSNTSSFGMNNNSSNAPSFGINNNPSTNTPFGMNNNPPNTTPFGMNNQFGQNNNNSITATTGLFGNQQNNNGFNLLNQQTTQPTSLFGGEQLGLKQQQSGFGNITAPSNPNLLPSLSNPWNMVKLSFNNPNIQVNSYHDVEILQAFSSIYNLAINDSLLSCLKIISKSGKACEEAYQIEPSTPKLPAVLPNTPEYSSYIETQWAPLFKKNENLIKKILAIRIMLSKKLYLKAKLTSNHELEYVDVVNRIKKAAHKTEVAISETEMSQKYRKSLDSAPEEALESENALKYLNKFKREVENLSKHLNEIKNQVEILIEGEPTG